MDALKKDYDLALITHRVISQTKSRTIADPWLSAPGLTWLGLDAKIAAGTTALAVVFSSLSGFLGHVALGGLAPTFLVTMAALAAAGSFAGSKVMATKLSSAQLKRFIGVLLWVIALKMALDLLA